MRLLKNERKAFFQAFLILFLICFQSKPAMGQGKTLITTGVGVPEFLNVGLMHQFKQIQLGLTLGTLPGARREYYLSISGDIYWHFAGKAKFTKLKPWYGKFGLNWLGWEDEIEKGRDLYLNTRVGRDFNLSENFGIKFDLGAIYALEKVRIVKKPSSSYNFFQSDVWPSLGLGLFYRL